MKNTRLILCIICSILFTTTLHAGPAADAITVAGEVSKPGDWTADKIKTELAADLTTLSYTGHDGKHTSTVVPLVSLLKAAGVATQLKQDPKAAPGVKHAELHYVITVEGRDGYYMVFSIAELMKEIGNRKVYLALDADGKPWNETEAPMKLIALDDEKPARWVHSLQKITVMKITPSATQPAGHQAGN